MREKALKEWGRCRSCEVWCICPGSHQRWRMMLSRCLRSSVASCLEGRSYLSFHQFSSVRVFAFWCSSLLAPLVWHDWFSSVMQCGCLPPTHLQRRIYFLKPCQRHLDLISPPGAPIPNTQSRARYRSTRCKQCKIAWRWILQLSPYLPSIKLCLDATPSGYYFSSWQRRKMPPTSSPHWDRAWAPWWRRCRSSGVHSNRSLTHSNPGDSQSPLHGTVSLTYSKSKTWVTME